MKIISNYKELKKIRLKYKKKIIGLCHGAFDIFHIGHLNHIQEAKKNCDILIISITSSEFILKSPSLPYNDDHSRLELVKNLEPVDYVFLDKSPSATLVLDSLEPNIYFKGNDYNKSTNDYVGNLKKELLLLKKKKIKFHTTKTPLLSSSKIYLNNYSDLNDLQIKFIKNFKKNFLFIDVTEEINKLKKKSVNIFGETIIDKFDFIKILGLASKFPVYSGVKQSEQIYPGGTLAVANVASEFVNKVSLITGFDKKKIPAKFINKKNIYLKKIPNLTHQIKTRYLNEYRNERFFQISNLSRINNQKNFAYQIKELNKFKSSTTNLIFDYGVWESNKKVLDFINSKKINYSLNVQTNSLNFGENLIKKYKNYELCVLDYKEYCLNLGLPVEQFKYQNINSIKRIRNNFYTRFKKNNSTIVVTLGKDGSVVFNKKSLYYCPVFIKSAIDTTGCGDMFFLIFSLLIKNNTPLRLSQFLATAYAGLHSLFIGNKKIVDKFEFIKYINFLYKI